MELSVSNILGQGYDEVFLSECRYNLLCGGRNTKKSWDTCAILLLKLVMNEEVNVIACRQNEVDCGDSVFNNFCEKIHMFGMDNMFKITKNPLKIERIATKQVIIFRGFNNPTGITSAKPPRGIFTHVWIEEASEVNDYDAFRKIDGTIRGKTESNVVKQFFISMNPWDIDTFWYEEFVKDKDIHDLEDRRAKGYSLVIDKDFNIGFGKGLLIHKSCYTINEFREPTYDEGAKIAEEKIHTLWLTEFMGEFGNINGATYDTFKDELILDRFAISSLIPSEFCIGIDIGISNGVGRISTSKDNRSATTMVLAGVVNNDKLIAYDEYYWTNINAVHEKTEPEIQTEMIMRIKSWIEAYPWLRTRRIRILFDSASPGFRQSFEYNAKRYGLQAVFDMSTKLAIHNRVSFENTLMGYGELYFSNKCENLIREIKSARRGKKGEIREAGNDHTIDAFDYASTPLFGYLRRFKNFKSRVNDPIFDKIRNSM